MREVCAECSNQFGNRCLMFETGGKVWTTRNTTSFIQTQVYFLSFIIKYKDNTWLSEHETFCLMSLSSQHLRQVFLLNYGFPRKLFKSRIIFLYFFLSARAGGIQQILQSDWFQERAEFSHPVRSRRAESTFIKNCFNLAGNLLKDLCYYVSKNLQVKPLSSTWIISVFITICSLEIGQFVANLAMITALKCSGLSHAFRCVVEKNVFSTAIGLRPRAVSSRTTYISR